VLALVAVVGLAVAACGTTDAGVIATRSRTGEGSGGLFPTDTLAPGDTLPAQEPDYPVQDGVVDFGEAGPQHPAYDGYLTAAFGDIQAYWKETFPATYHSPWEPLSGGIFAAYPGRQSPIPGCGTDGPSTYEDVQAGTAFYCITGDFMAYDDADGLPGLVDQLGKEAVAVVLAHEFGHAIQARAGEWDNPGVLKEQQADCFAGAWTAHVAAGGSDLIRFDDSAIRAGLVAMIFVSDPVEGNGLAEEGAHGTGFDRVGAFQDGFEGGAARCATFFTEDRVSKLIDIPFDYSDTNAGNLPLVDPNPDPSKGPADIVTLIPEGLDQFWVPLADANGVPFTKPTFSPFPGAGPYPTCDGIDPSQYPNGVLFCPGDNTIYWDQDFAASMAADPLTGDMSVGYLFADAYSDAIQTALRSKKAGESRALLNDCLTGAWVASTVPSDTQSADAVLTLSAGDLDEAIVTAIARADQSTDTNVNGSAFEKIDAFRTGVLGGLNVCRNEIG
jgi:predicted metalloprotease